MKKEILNNDALTLRVNAEPIANAVEEAIENIEGAVRTVEDGVERVVTVTKSNPLLIAGALVIGLGVGGFIAYKVAVKRTSLKYEDILTEEIAAAKSFHQRLAKTGEFESPESAVQALVPDEVVDAISSYQGKDKVIPYNNPRDIVIEAETVEITKNVFVEAHEDPRDWDFKVEVVNREANPDSPYVISFEEFHENTDSHEQATLAYYVEDDTLTDEREQPIDNTDYTVGDDNLTRFGHGSNDSTVVYVRNEKMGMDFEIIRSEGSYKKEVLGLDDSDSIRHSHRRSHRRQWGTDE